jgi:hypothetical protein
MQADRDTTIESVRQRNFTTFIRDRNNRTENGKSQRIRFFEAVGDLCVRIAQSPSVLEKVCGDASIRAWDRRSTGRVETN